MAEMQVLNIKKEVSDSDISRPIYSQQNSA